MSDLQPRFWDELIRSLPVCVQIEKNWEKIRDEYIVYENTQHPYSDNKVSLPAPNVTLSHARYENPQSDLPEGDRRKLYTGSWDVAVAGTPPASDPKQWANTEMVKKILRWKTKANLETHLEHVRKQFKTFNSIVAEFADSNQCSGGMFSIMYPGAVVNPHFGSDQLMRSHLCLINDKDCRITVGDETKSWEEGKILAFKDGPPFEHSVRHEGTSRRLVLMFDFDLAYLRGKFPNEKFL